jgi:conjugal transfer pilus assembly protein TraW
VTSAYAQSQAGGNADLMTLLKQRKEQAQAMRGGLDDISMQPGQADLRAAQKAMGITQGPPSNPAAEQFKQASTIVFISLGMPDEDLRYLFNEGRGKKDVVFLLRGSFNDDMKETMQRLAKLADLDKEKAPAPPNVMILPQAFANYQIDAVPVVFRQARGNAKDWFKAVGAPSLAIAAKAIDEGQAGRVLGKLYPIAERDIVERMREAASKFDWGKWRRHMAADWRAKFENGTPLPVALNDASYTVDLSITFPSDLTDKDGKVVVKAGTRVNPLEKTGVPGEAIVVIDPLDARQRGMAKQWLSKWPGAIVMVTRIDEQAIRDLGVKVMMVDAVTAGRFQLQAVPSLLTAQNNRLLVRTYASRVKGNVIPQ